MRFYAIALFILLFNGSLYMMNAMGVAYDIDTMKSPAVPSVNITQYDEAEFNNTLGKLVPTGQTNVLYDMYNMVNFVITGVGQLVRLFISSTFGFPFMLYNEFSLPMPLVMVIGFGMFLTYIAGIIDFLRGGDSLGS